jgi:hypothetical protein
LDICVERGRADAPSLRKVGNASVKDTSVSPQKEAARTLCHDASLSQSMHSVEDGKAYTRIASRLCGFSN